MDEKAYNELVASILNIPDKGTPWPDKMSQSNTYVHPGTGATVQINKKEKIRMSDDMLMEFIKKGRVVMLDAKTFQPVKEYNGVPLPTMDEVIARRRK